MTTPPYNPNTPKAKDIFSESAQPFQVNFKNVANAFQIDHVALTAVSPTGAHNAIHLQELSSPAQTNLDDFSVYGRPIKGQPTQLFMRFHGNQDEFRYVNYQIYPLDVIVENGTTQTSFFTFIPGNFIVYFGSVTNASKPTTYNVKLNPEICKTIISVNTTGLGDANASTAPWQVSTLKAKDIVTTVSLRSPGIAGVAGLYYTIVGNASS